MSLFSDDTPPEEIPGLSNGGTHSLNADVQQLLREQKTAHDKLRQAEKKVTAARVFLGAMAGAVLMTVGATVSTLAYGQTKIDAGVAPVAEALAEHKKEEAERFSRLERRVDEGQHRQDLKMDALLMRFGIPNPAPTPERTDAGQ